LPGSHCKLDIPFVPQLELWDHYALVFVRNDVGKPQLLINRQLQRGRLQTFHNDLIRVALLQVFIRTVQINHGCGKRSRIFLECIPELLLYAIGTKLHLQPVNW
jgi:hypothetical protein